LLKVGEGKKNTHVGDVDEKKAQGKREKPAF